VLPLDAAGKERVRLEDCPTCATGRLPNKNFVAARFSNLGRNRFRVDEIPCEPAVNRAGKRGKDGQPENLLVRRREVGLAAD
jgi:hypothetical protein